MSDEVDKPRSRSATASSEPEAARPCPVCKSPITADSPGAIRFRPFCSRACADIDLLRWLRGSYVVAGTGNDDDEDGETSRTPPSVDPSEDTRH